MLRFDFTGLGASEGEFANTNFSSNVADLVAAADHLRAGVPRAALLIGHSLGGAAVLAAALEIAGVEGGGHDRRAQRSHACGRAVPRPRAADRSAGARPKCSWPGARSRIKRQFLLDAAEQKLAERRSAA